MENSKYQLSCAVGCEKLKVALILDGAKGKIKPGWSFPIRDAVVAECMATNPPTEMARFEGLTPDGRPDSFRPSNAIYIKIPALTGRGFSDNSTPKAELP